MDSTYDKRPQSHSMGVGVRGRNITHVTRLYNVTSETNYVIIYTCAQYVHTYNDLEMKKKSSQFLKKTLHSTSFTGSGRTCIPIYASVKKEKKLPMTDKSHRQTTACQKHNSM
jgi:4-diphosphocytidyl-2C-methyl-D-erythritol kinase